MSFENINMQNLLKLHSEIKSINHKELEALCKIVRNKGVIIDPFHKTVPFLTKYEISRILGLRTKQINNGAPPFVSIDDNIIDGFTIAQRELMEKKIPFIIQRPMPDGSSEYWRVRDLEILNF